VAVILSEAVCEQRTSAQMLGFAQGDKD